MSPVQDTVHIVGQPAEVVFDRGSYRPAAQHLLKGLGNLVPHLLQNIDPLGTDLNVGKAVMRTITRAITRARKNLHQELQRLLSQTRQLLDPQERVLLPWDEEAFDPAKQIAQTFSSSARTLIGKLQTENRIEKNTVP